MSRKSVRLTSSVDEEPFRMPMTKITHVYKRPKKDTSAATSGKENNANISNKTANEDNIKKKEEVKKTEEKEETKKNAAKKKETKKKRDSIGKQKKSQKSEEITTKKVFI